MFIIVSKDQRVPDDLKTFEYEIWSFEEFVEKANSDEGIDVDRDGGIYINLDSLSFELYQALQAFAEVYTIRYYQFSDQNINIPFDISEGVITYEVEQEVVEEPQIQEPVAETQSQVIEEKDSVEENYQEEVNQQQSLQKESENYSAGNINVATDDSNSRQTSINLQDLDNILQTDEHEYSKKKTENPAKVILFGSSKGGTGKTFTCLISAYRFAKTHPDLRIALADFDIIDGQIGVTINKISPTIAEFYKHYRVGQDDFETLHNCHVNSDHFGPNIDFYLAPSKEIPEVTNDLDFWTRVHTLLITNYDVVFFDSGIDYLGKPPISQLYQIADKIILTCNPSINSVKSIIKQLKRLKGGDRDANEVFKPTDKIIDRTNIVLTRVYKNDEINNIVISNLTKHAPVIAAFGNIDEIVSNVQWYQQWELISASDNITKYLDIITELK